MLKSVSLVRNKAENISISSANQEIFLYEQVKLLYTRALLCQNKSPSSPEIPPKSIFFSSIALLMSFNAISAVGSHVQCMVVEEIPVRLLNLLTSYS